MKHMNHNNCIIKYFKVCFVLISIQLLLIGYFDNSKKIPKILSSLISQMTIH